MDKQGANDANQSRDSEANDDFFNLGLLNTISEKE